MYMLLLPYLLLIAAKFKILSNSTNFNVLKYMHFQKNILNKSSSFNESQ